MTGLTTTPRDEAVTLADDDWIVGGLPRQSHVSPSFLTTLKHDTVERGVGMLSPETVDAVATAVARYLPSPSADG